MFRIFSQKIDTNPKKIQKILERGVEDIFVKESLEKKLKSGRRLNIKLGFDPTGPNIHIGRAIVLRKLKAFQDLGHNIIFIVGDFTAQIGDPSDKLEKRPFLSSEKIAENLKNYKEQLGKILDLSKVKFLYNSSWLSNLTLKETAELAESFTVGQMANRRNFKERIDRGEEVSLREFLYPLMQGYDSLKVEADVELGGFDQLFNLKAGRIVQKHFGKKEQDILTTKMLEGTDGRKMSTSWGNVINIIDSPKEMYGKVMSIKDELLPQYFILCTDLEKLEIDSILSGNDPRSAKMRLAKEIVSIYHNSAAAREAEEGFVNTFSKKEIPEDIKVVTVEKNRLLSDVLVDEKILSSKTEFKRFAEEGGIHNLGSDSKITDFKYLVSEPIKIRIGKKNFLEIKVI
ncbi:MAG: tyrosine--tRNA ligase [Candidatus Pacebacteria bacterium]|nr:tyrosine--tRNA ligase [Candidatus Paceibacterota bacterium]